MGIHKSYFHFSFIIYQLGYYYYYFAKYLQIESGFTVCSQTIIPHLLSLFIWLFAVNIWVQGLGKLILLMSLIQNQPRMLLLFFLIGIYDFLLNNRSQAEKSYQKAFPVTDFKCQTYWQKHNNCLQFGGQEQIYFSRDLFTTKFLFDFKWILNDLYILKYGKSTA